MDQTRPLGHSNVQKWPNMAPNFPHGSNMTICGWTMGWLKYDEDTFLSVDFFSIHLWEKSFYKETLLPANLMYYSCLVTTANDLTLFTVQFWLGDDVLVFLFSKWCIPWVIGYQYASHLSISLLPNCPGLNGQSCAWQSPSLPPALFWSVADFHVLLYLKMI